MSISNFTKQFLVNHLKNIKFNYYNFISMKKQDLD